MAVNQGFSYYIQLINNNTKNKKQSFYRIIMTKYKIKYLQEAGSTNDYMKKLMSDRQIEEGTVILADYQNSGRGRGKNSWYSGRGLNLTFSVLLLPGIHATNFFYLTEILSLTIVDFLNSYRIKACIKWPNDIYVGDDKIAGILIENIIMGNKIVKSIAGVGINVNEENFPEDIPNPTSMKIITQKTFIKDALMDILFDKFDLRYKQLISGDMESMHNEYNHHLYKRGILSEYSQKKNTFQAVLKEVRPSGEIVLVTKNNSENTYLFGEIELILNKT